jgi:hypothetical protein
MNPAPGTLEYLQAAENIQKKNETKVETDLLMMSDGMD